SGIQSKISWSIIIIIISSLPSGRSLASNFSTLPYPPLSSPYSHKTPPSDHKSSQSLVCPSVSFPPFFPPTQALTTHHLSQRDLFCILFLRQLTDAVGSHRQHTYYTIINNNFINYKSTGLHSSSSLVFRSEEHT